MGFFEGLSLYASVGISMCKVVTLPLVVWFLLGRPRAWWPYVSVCVLGVVALLFNEVGDLIAAWWNRDGSPNPYFDSVAVDDKLIQALEVRAEGVALAILGASAAFFLASE